MSSLLRPVGHLPDSVYWFRRALVLVVSVVLLVLLIRLFGGGDDPQNTAATGPDQNPSAPVVPTGSGSPSPSGKNTAKTSTTVQPSETPKTSEPPKDLKCAGTDVRINVVPSGRSITVGASLNFAIQLSGLSDECKATIDPTRLSLTITSGTDQIWTTSHCEQAIPRATLVVAKGKESTSTVAWNGRRSGPGCLPGQPQAKAGTYVAKAVYDGQASPAQAFYIV